MLNTVSKIRGQVKTTGYPQTEGLLGDSMLRYGRELGEESTFGNVCTYQLSRTHMHRHEPQTNSCRNPAAMWWNASRSLSLSLSLLESHKLEHCALWNLFPGIGLSFLITFKHESDTLWCFVDARHKCANNNYFTMTSNVAHPVRIKAD